MAGEIIRFGKKEPLAVYKIKIFEQADNDHSKYEERTQLC